MNVAGLLADLNARSYIERVGTWTIVDTKDDGTVLYSAPTFQTVGGNAASYINVQVYVWHEGQQDEQAWYKDIPPDQKPRTSGFMDVLVAAIDAAPTTLKGIQVLAINERYRDVIYTTLEVSGTDLVQTAWYWHEGDAPLKIVNFNPELLGSILKV
jgi:hypothetical protein